MTTDKLKAKLCAILAALACLAIVLGGAWVLGSALLRMGG